MMLRKRWIRRTAVAATAILSAVTVAGSTSAMALPLSTVVSPPSMPTDALDALDALGLLESQNARTVTSSLDLENGLVVDGLNGSRVVLTPVSTVDPSLEADGRALQYADSASYQFVLTGADAIANAGYVVVANEAAPTDFQFHVQVDGGDARLLNAGDGGVDVLDADGSLVNHFAAPWATDANGSPVATSYSVSGSTITQNVSHGGSAYPVVADPQLVCDALFCTAMLSKAETRTAASGMNAAAAAVAVACGPAAWACAIGAGIFLDSANQANNKGMCVGVRKAHPSPLAWPVIDTCRS
ncbi:hypothetical protein [Plantibacter sp. RU18]|uniref:hypothetical protein n=1 Tax=Plantibacter sp. RU18 TaxID=3158143 RepID=UPI003D35C0D8